MFGASNEKLLMYCYLFHGQLYAGSPRCYRYVATPWERRSPERLGINAQVGDPFYGQLYTGSPRTQASSNRS